MAQIDHSIYFQQQTPDFFGSAIRGFEMGGKLSDLAKKRKEEAALGEAFKANMVQNPDGTTSFNRMGFLSQLGQSGAVSPERMMGYQDQYDQMQLAQADKQAQASRWQTQFDADQKHRADQMGIERARIANERAKTAAAANAASQNSAAAKKYADTFVPGIGNALNADDAKKLKDGVEMKGKFDRQVGELIGLRSEYGVEYMNRNAVERAKQLSKDLLLTYKNLAKLGVLSKSDENIINDILPEDPLGQDLAPFQDPILHRLEMFKKDIDDDFRTTVKTRTGQEYRPGSPAEPKEGDFKEYEGILYRVSGGQWVPVQRVSGASK